MKKIFLTLLILCFVVSYGFCSTVNSYDSYGRKTGSYRTSGSTTTSYDKYGRKTGTIKQTSSGYATYDNMGRKTSTVSARWIHNRYDFDIKPFMPILIE